MKIVGNTVGMGLPKPNLKQTDPRKGDFVKGKDEIPAKVSQLENDSGYMTEVPKGYATEEFVTNKIAEAELGGKEVDLSGYAQKSEVPTKTSQLTNDSGFLTDAPVRSVNGKTGAISLSASDVGAMPTGTKIPSKTSELTNDSGYITGYTETDPTVPAWAKESTKPSYTKSEVGLGNVDNLKQYSASNPPPYPVTSVNGKTGAVTLDATAVGARPANWMPSASDVGALPASTSIPSKTSQMTNDSGFITGYTETDPTVPSWAKQAKKPTYTAAEVNADPSGTAASAVNAHNQSNAAHADIRAAISQLSENKVDIDSIVQGTGDDPGFVMSQKAVTDAISETVADLKAQGVQQVPLFANSIEECTDTTKVYVLPDGYVYGYILTDTDPEPLYINRLPESINEDGTQFVGTNGEDGYKDGYRISGSSGTSGGVTGGGEKAQAGYQVTGFIPVRAGQVVRVKNVDASILVDISRYCTCYYFSEGFAKVSVTTVYFDEITPVDGVYQWTVQSTGYGSNIRYMRLTLGGTTKETIVTVDQEIKMSAGGTGYAWANTGRAFVPADYEDRIFEIEADVAEHDNQIADLAKKVANINADASLTAAYERIKRWRYPIYEDAPVFLLETNKAALSGNFENTNAVYAKYDALMAEHSHYITKVNCGMASDGTTPIYAYHFAEPTPHAFSSNIYLETKPVIVVCSGVHPKEIAGVYCMYYAMEEITTNPKLLDLRRNVHFIIMPMINPTAFNDTEYYMRNPDGIQVHYNFEVDFGTNGTVQGDRNYGGASPLSIPETQYFDALMSKHKDYLAGVISCHNNVVDEKYGTGFIWCSCATDHMVNLGNRFVDKMSAAWLEKHGEAFLEGIRWANDYAISHAGSGMFFDDVAEQPYWDYRVGRSSLSGSGGTEYKQALKYGAHGVNVEVCPRCMVLDKDYNATYTSNVMTMGAETYINYFRTFMEVYDPKNKKDYAPNLPWSE